MAIRRRKGERITFPVKPDGSILMTYEEIDFWERAAMSVLAAGGNDTVAVRAADKLIGLRRIRLGSALSEQEREDSYWAKGK